ncbi:uncharacterized protein LOC106175976 [Lingula anatina]|uniref:Uncharacterized protein LOC106175976 n=1 Tax=Lingula anatina TaxID=7574 RepID=A0A1S3JTI1_LINAN|nr:uncharacterized protein LOC106175976 [Lingula anatina]|eukprot:XP_013413628.1 uncharacterized protein LOC106175976 [Lingula anatina]
MNTTTASVGFDLASLYPGLSPQELCWVYQGKCWCATMYVLTIFGFVGSLLTFIVVLRSERLRSRSTFVYLLFLAAVDEFVLLYLSGECLNFHLSPPSTDHVCTIDSVGHVVSDTLVYLSVIYVTAVTVERLIIVKWPLKAAYLCRRRTAIVACIVTAFVVLAFNGFNLSMCYVGVETKLSVITAGNYMFIIIHVILCLTIAVLTAIIIFQLSRSSARRRQMSTTTPAASASSGSTRESFAQKTHVLLLTTPISFTILTWPKYGFDIWLTTIELQGWCPKYESGDWLTHPELQR